VSKAPQATPYEEAIIAICLGLFFIGIGLFMRFTSHDLGEPMGRVGLPGWALVGLLWISGAGAVGVGVIRLLKGARP
jgi:hypothetical protein